MSPLTRLNGELDVPLYHRTLFYGKVDFVPELFFVATRFVHIFLLPLVPFQSCLVYEGLTEQKSELGYLNTERFTTPALHWRFNLKSVLVAWFRTFLVFNAAC